MYFYQGTVAYSGFKADIRSMLKFSEHFNCDGFYNGKQSWLSDDSSLRIYWDNVTTPNCWRMSGATMYNLQVINTNPASPPINGNWTGIGIPYTVASSKGECPNIDQLVLNATVLSPACNARDVSGSITATATGGVPPYTYSKDSGVTYVNTPFFTNLRPGGYNVCVSDSTGYQVCEFYTVAQPPSPARYNIRLNTISNNLTNQNVNPITLTMKYSVEVVIAGTNTVTTLPQGSTINFDAILSNSVIRSPYAQSAVVNSYTLQVKKNGVVLTNPITDNSSETSYPNQTPGCYGSTTYKRINVKGMAGLTYVNGDNYEITTVTTVTKNCNYNGTTETEAPSGPLYELNQTFNDGESLPPLTFDLEDYATTYRNCCILNMYGDTGYQLNNIELVGCSCCSAFSWDYFYNRS